MIKLKDLITEKDMWPPKNKYKPTQDRQILKVDLGIKRYNNDGFLSKIID